jgi:DNA relaxase NicK
MMSLQTTVFSIDAFTMTVHRPFADVLPFVEKLGFELEHSGHGTKGYRDQYNGLHGARVGCNPGGQDTRCTIFLLGEALGFCGIDAVLEMVRGISEAGFRFKITRCDAALDTQEFTTMQVSDAWYRGLITTRSEYFKPIPEYKNRELIGLTLYFGSRQSPQFLRVYHKIDGHSFGEGVPFTRVEMEYHDDKAHATFREFFMRPKSEWAALAAGFLSSFIQIEVDWWHSWLEGVDKAWVCVSHPKSSIQRKEEYLYRQVSPSLATWLQAKSGGDMRVIVHELRRLIQHGRHNMQSHHHSMVREYQTASVTRYAAFGV